MNRDGHELHWAVRALMKRAGLRGHMLRWFIIQGDKIVPVRTRRSGDQVA